MGSKKRRSFTNKYGDPSLTGGEESPARPSAGGRRSEDYIPDENDWVSRAYVPPSNDNGCCCTNLFCCLTNSSGVDEEEGNHNKSSSKCNGCGPCTSYTSKSVAAVMMIGLIVLAALGIGLMVFGAMEQVKPVVKLCATCNGITVASLVAGGIAILLLFIGVIALYRMNRILSVIFSVLMLLICAMFLAVFIAVLVFRYDPPKLCGALDSNLNLRCIAPRSCANLPGPCHSGAWDSEPFSRGVIVHCSPHCVFKTCGGQKGSCDGRRDRH